MSTLPYDNYRESGIEWVARLPAHWETIRLRWLCDIKKNIAGKLGFDILSITQQGIKIKDLESNEGQLSMDYSKYQMVEVGDFAMNHMDLLTGFVDISPVLGVTSPDYRVFRMKDGAPCLPQYLLYILQIGYKYRIFFPFGQGSSQLGRWRLPTEQFRDLRFPLPPIEEQQAIVSFLAAEIAKIESLIGEQQRLATLLTEKLIAQAMPNITSGGRQIRIGNAVDVMARPLSWEDGVSYTAIGLYNRGRGTFSKPPREHGDMGDSEFFWVQEGDLILSGQFSWEGAVAVAGPEDTGRVVSHRYHVLRGKRDIALTDYLFAYLITKHGDFLLNECSRGAAGRNRPLNINRLLKETITLPDLTDQEKVARALVRRKAILADSAKQINLLNERGSPSFTRLYLAKLIASPGLASKPHESAQRN
jgi:type I restriction enzyme S subunit